MITLKEATQIAKKISPEYNEMQEYTDAWYCYVDDGDFHVGGPQTGKVILKDSGNVIYPYEYFLGDDYEAEDVGDPVRI